MIIGILSAAFVVLLTAGVPIAFGLALAGLLAIVATGTIPLRTIPQLMYGALDNFTLLSVPLFIFAGTLMETGGISRRLVELALAIVGRLRGGLAMSVVVGEYFFSGISGSTAADVSAVGSVMIPSMRRAGYSAGEAVAVVSAASAMGILVPPCVAMLILSSMSNLTVGELFAAGLLPAIVIALFLMGYLYVEAVRRGRSVDTTASRGELARAIIGSLPPLGMPALIMGAIIGGIATPTEAAVVAVFYGLIVAFIYRELSVVQTLHALVESARTTAVVLFLLATASVFSWVLVRQQVPEALAGLLASLNLSAPLFLLITIVLYVILGGLLEGLPALIILTPILFPVAKGLGINLLHFGILSIASLGVGLFLPPIGLGIVVACSIAKCDVADSIKPLLPIMVVLFLGLIVVALVPWFTLIVPELVFQRPVGG